MGSRLIILGHHYQKDEIIAISDYIGDSLGLCQKAAEQQEAEFIAFCGVHFMAESADILSSEDQIVQLPDLAAGCSLAEMANISQIKAIWQELDSISSVTEITPITYINSDSELKAFCGRHGGAVCTSSNAEKILTWALNKTEKVFFFPDQHLGRNSSNRLGIPRNEIYLWNSDKHPDRRQIEKARVILWDGNCSVHTFFTVKHIQQVRSAHPEAKIIVHPECDESVVNASDAWGSTGQIIEYVEKAPAASLIVIGTEFNLVNRLTQKYPDKKIMPLAKSICPTMDRIDLNNLCHILENPGKINVIQVPAEIKLDARIALQRMLNPYSDDSHDAQYDR